MAVVDEPAVPISRSSYVSHSPDEAWDALSRMYTGARPHTASPEARIRFTTAATTDLAVDRGWLHTAQGSFDASPDQLNFISVVGGRISLDFGRRGAVFNDVGDSYVYLPDGSADLQWDAFGALALRLPRHRVAEAAAELTDLDAGALRFLSAQPVSAARARLWLHTAEMLWRQLHDSQTPTMNGLIHQQLVTAAASVAISVFPNTAMMRGYVAGPGDVRPAAVRRAAAYIDAHSSLPITMIDIAEAAGTSVRAIRAAFRQHLNMSPTAYLGRVRLAAARRDLRTADASDAAAVAAIATRWGFSTPDGFIAAHCRVYGEPPDTGS